MKRRAVDARPVAGVDVAARAAAPLLAAADELALDDALRAERDRDGPVRVLVGRRHEDARALRERGRDVGRANDLREVRRADLLLALRDEDEVDRELPPRALVRVESGEERGLGTLLVDAPRPITTLPKPGLSTSAASNGGELHSDGSACLTSYMKYTP
jgi:hypothetical protein